MPVAPDLTMTVLDGRYELHAPIGEGAFGTVYRGRDRRLGRPVAVKVIKPWWAEDPAWVRRFEREAQLLARVTDPGIVQVFDIGRAPEGLYYVAELVEGESLAERLERGPLGIGEAARVARRAAAALGRAHAAGIVHRDVKPANILLGADGAVKVGDFGVARLSGAGATVTGTSGVFGTPRYMAPEQSSGAPATPAADVYALGVVLYEMLAGTPPFGGRSAVEVALQHLNAPVPPLPGAAPPALEAVVLRALAKEPAGRYADGREMAAALSASDVAGLAVPPRPGSRRRPAVGVDPPSPRTEATRVDPPAPRTEAKGVDPPAPRTEATRVASAPPTARLHGRRRLRSWSLLLPAVLLVAALAGAAAYSVPRLRAAHARVAVASVVGERQATAVGALRRAGLVPRTRVVPVPGGAAGTVSRQAPRAGTRLHKGDAVVLTVVAMPRWRAAASLSGSDDGGTGPFRIRGDRWRVRYHVEFPDGCGLIFGCMSPTATVRDASGAEIRSFDLEEGDHVAELTGQPGTYRIDVSAGADRTDWTLAVDDRY